MQGRRRAKRIKARRRLFYPCILGGRCNALPPPGPGDSPSIGTAAGPAKRQKAGLLTAQCAAPPAQVGGVSDVECPERGRSGAGPTKGRGLGGGYTFQGCGNIGRYAVAPGRESARGRYRGLAVFGDGLGMAGAAAGVAHKVGHPRVVILGTIGSVVAPKRKRASPFGLALSTESRTASTVSAPCRNIYSIAQPFSVVNTFFVWLPLAALAASLPRGTLPPTGGRGGALPAGLACAITPGPRRAACGPGREPAATVCAVRRSCRVACLPWPGPPRSFGGPWSRVSACCWDGPKEQRALWWLRTKRPLTKRGRV